MELPYLPEGREILYVGEDNDFLQKAKEMADTFSKHEKQPTGAVIVRDGRILGRGSNHSDYHDESGCERKKNGSPTGQGYETCPGCKPCFHAEQQAIDDAHERLEAFAREDNLGGADLYLWGHWWCCESCWGKMIGAGIKNVYLVENAVDKFSGRKKEEKTSFLGKIFGKKKK
ncbi:hypothetical protein K9M41_04590 [Candidatus Gracilibacteria bacterium]|nr:hypothetical protein [Candidatus Gracilibacteria bacterium]